MNPRSNKILCLAALLVIGLATIADSQAANNYYYRPLIPAVVRPFTVAPATVIKPAAVAPAVVPKAAPVPAVTVVVDATTGLVGLKGLTIDEIIFTLDRVIDNSTMMLNLFPNVLEIQHVFQMRRDTAISVKQMLVDRAP